MVWRMDEKLMAAISAAVQAYIETGEPERKRIFGQRLNAWKMAARREIMNRGRLAQRSNPMRVRLRRFSLY